MEFCYEKRDAIEAVIKRAAQDMGIAPQAVLQTYMFERVLDRIARSVIAISYY